MNNSSPDIGRPPIWADRLLEFFCKGELLEEVQGDLAEYYFRTYKQKGRRKAGIVYWYHVINFLRPFALKKLKSNSNTTTMIRFNLMIALRNLNRYRFYSFLNISGLAIGLASCLFIMLFVMDELSYDKFHPDYKRIYRVASDLRFGNNQFDFPVTPAPMAESFLKDFPEIEMAGKMHTYGTGLVKKGDAFYKQKNIFYASQGLLDIFRFPAVYGSLDNAITEPNTIVLSHSSAKKIFGDVDPVGESIEIDDRFTVKVTGVYEDLPENSHFHPELLISIENDRGNDNVWLGNNYYTYFLLNAQNDETGLEAKFASVYEKYFAPQLKEMVGVDFDEMMASGDHINYYLQPVADIHLNSHLAVEVEANGSMEYVYIFSAIALFILVIACINFMNLSTARAAMRAKEVGIKKVLGSVRRQLISQFLTESILFAFLASLVAVLLVVLLLPLFNSFSGKEVGHILLDRPIVWVYLVAAVFGIGVLAGLYPAFYLSKYQPTAVLKGTYQAGSRASWFRNVLVVFQFATSLFLIIGSLTVYSQLNYTQNRDLGFDREQVIILENVGNLGDKNKVLRNELAKNASVVNTSISSFYPLSDFRSDQPFLPEGTTSIEESVSCQVWSVDFDYLKTFEMEVVSGRDFDIQMPSDSSGVVINETAAKRFGIEQATGQKIKVLGDFGVQGKKEFTVLGVVKDFHFESLRNNVVPVLLFITKYSADHMAVRLKTDNLSRTLADLEETWSQVAGGIPFEYQFLNQSFEAKYRSESQLGTIFAVFSGLAIFIGCLGLFGLSAYTAERRKKELGIRKVLGAEVFSLVRLLFTEFSVLLVIAIIVAIPLAWYAMNLWLNDFAYRVGLSLGTFVVSSLIVILVGLVTVSFQSFKAARSNPVDNLKYE
ncbi:MAG: FtsX-like permease family protein [Imperialibacter sp.]|uniref:ABC transporter permease n=1 Tax=Imperialibacter sp. TaxID=2038411 RepID=UPI0032ECA64E